MCFFPQGTSERWKNSQRCFQVEEVDFLDFLENHVAIFRIMTSPCDLTLGPVKSWKTIPVSFKLAHAAAFNALADCVAWWYRERSQLDVNRGSQIMRGRWNEVHPTYEQVQSSNLCNQETKENHRTWLILVSLLHVFILLNLCCSKRL